MFKIKKSYLWENKEKCFLKSTLIKMHTLLKLIYSQQCRILENKDNYHWFPPLSFSLEGKIME